MGIGYATTKYTIRYIDQYDREREEEKDFWPRWVNDRNRKEYHQVVFKGDIDNY